MSRGRTITVKMWGNGGGADLWCDAAMVDEIRKVDGVRSVDLGSGERSYIVFEHYCDPQHVCMEIEALGKPKTPKFTVRRGGDIRWGFPDYFTITATLNIADADEFRDFLKRFYVKYPAYEDWSDGQCFQKMVEEYLLADKGGE